MNGGEGKNNTVLLFGGLRAKNNAEAANVVTLFSVSLHPRGYFLPFFFTSFVTKIK